jgi:uncharacterized cupredoxin-like copper-binding protein
MPIDEIGERLGQHALAAIAITSLALVPFASARSDHQTRVTASSIQVKGGEFFFKLSAKSIAKPGKVTFVFKNVGHVEHDFKINGKKTPLTQPGKTAKLVVMFTKRRSTPISAPCPDMPLRE